MSGLKDRFLFASAPDSWGVLDYPGPSWKQSYEKILDEMVSAGYTGTELGPYQAAEKVRYFVTRRRVVRLIEHARNRSAAGICF
jgi:sugar phosphate isomerase/epimerase